MTISIYIVWLYAGVFFKQIILDTTFYLIPVVQWCGNFTLMFLNLNIACSGDKCVIGNVIFEINWVFYIEAAHILSQWPIKNRWSLIQFLTAKSLPTMLKQLPHYRLYKKRLEVPTSPTKPIFPPFISTLEGIKFASYNRVRYPQKMSKFK